MSFHLLSFELSSHYPIKQSKCPIRLSESLETAPNDTSMRCKEGLGFIIIKTQFLKFIENNMGDYSGVSHQKQGRDAIFSEIL